MIFYLWMHCNPPYFLLADAAAAAAAAALLPLITLLCSVYFAAVLPIL